MRECERPGDDCWGIPQDACHIATAQWGVRAPIGRGNPSVREIVSGGDCVLALNAREVGPHRRDTARGAVQQVTDA